MLEILLLGRLVEEIGKSNAGQNIVEEVKGSGGGEVPTQRKQNQQLKFLKKKGCLLTI